MTKELSGIIWLEIGDSSGISDFHAGYQGWEAKVHLQVSGKWCARIGYHSPANARELLEAATPQEAMAKATQWMFRREEETAERRAKQGKPPKKLLSLAGQKRRVERRMRANESATQVGYAAPYPELLGSVVAEHKIPFTEVS